MTYAACPGRVQLHQPLNMPYYTRAQDRESLILIKPALHASTAQVLHSSSQHPSAPPWLQWLAECPFTWAGCWRWTTEIVLLDMLTLPLPLPLHSSTHTLYTQGISSTCSSQPQAGAVCQNRQVISCRLTRHMVGSVCTIWCSAPW